VVRVPRVVDVRNGLPDLQDGRVLDVANVVWCTGFDPGFSWIDLPVFDGDGVLRHRRGVTDVPGLYFLGLSWQHTRGSALLGFVADDAGFIAERVDAHARTHPGAGSPSAAPRTEV
jgi:putative flavoprotein involved in K+ transport